MPQKRTAPRGNVSFLLYDGVGSSKAALRLPYPTYREDMLGRLYALTETLVMQHNGWISGTPHGDDCLAVFENVKDAIRCAVALQEQVRTISVTAADGKVWQFPIRIVVHKAVEEVEPDVRGHYQNHRDVIYAARVLPLACAGQILLTENALRNAGNPTWRSKAHPNRRLKSFEETPQVLYELLYDSVEDRAEPGSHYVPQWYEETYRYIARPHLEEAIVHLFAEKTANDQPYRLVTLHGFGGIGKTRLAIQCAIQTAGIFEDRIFYVPSRRPEFRQTASR